MLRSFHKEIKFSLIVNNINKIMLDEKNRALLLICNFCQL